MVASPTASMESLPISLLINFHENRDVPIFNVPGPYIQADLVTRKNGKRVLLKLAGYFVDIMCEVNSEHEKYIVYEKGRKVLLYCVINLYYELFSCS